MLRWEITFFGWSWSHILIKVSFHHSVIDFAVFGCFLANITFRLLESSDQIHRPTVEAVIGFSNLAVQSGHFRFGIQTLSVRWIGDDEAVFFAVA